MEMQKALDLTRKLMSEHKLHNWKVEARKYKTSFGKCHHRIKTISLSSVLVPYCTEKAVYDTITHEIAHAIAGAGHGHNAFWRAIHVKLGGNGKRCGGDDNYINGKDGKTELRQKIAKYIATCPAGHVHYRNRLPSGKTSCGIWCRRFNEKFLLIYTLNK